MTHQLSAPSLGYLDKRRVSDDANGAATIAEAMLEAATSNNTLDAALIASTAGYTQARVNQMTQNDKVYAARTLLDQGSLDKIPADYPPAP